MSNSSNARGAVLTPFSTPIFRVRLPDCVAMNRELEDLILARSRTVANAPRSARGGWQSPKDMQQWPEVAVQKFCAIAVEVAAGALSDYYPHAKPFVVRIGECWSNVNQRGSWNAPHNHGGFPWVASYYVRTQAQGVHMGGIYFQNPLTLSSNYWQRPEIGIEPEDGDLIIFPGAYMHYVEPNTTDTPRVSIALNFLVKPAQESWRLSMTHGARSDRG